MAIMTTITTTDLTHRVAGVRQAMATTDVDALLITPSADLRYLTGYAATPLERLTCLVLPAIGGATLIVPQLEQPTAAAANVTALDIEILPWAETEDPYALVAARLPDAARRVAVNNRMWAERVLALRALLPDAELTLAGPLLRELRMRKTPAEVEALRRAGQAIDRVHARMAEWLRPGRTEREVGRDIADAIIAEGHVVVDFVIVGSGPHGASPHHELSDRVIQNGDPIVVDIGGILAEGYCSDSTRTYVVGKPPPQFRDCYRVVQDAQQAAYEAVKPGVICEAVDAAARDLITAAGYGNYFIHRTGHGIGLEGHEDPYIVAGNDVPLAPGMVFSIEPGIYLSGQHGARIEDIVVCTENGAERLNNTSRELLFLGS